MIDREKVEAILTRRFPGVTPKQVAAATNAIVGLGDEWEEIVPNPREMGRQFWRACPHVCLFARDEDEDAEFRVLRRRFCQ